MVFFCFQAVFVLLRWSKGKAWQAKCLRIRQCQERKRRGRWRQIAGDCSVRPVSSENTKDERSGMKKKIQENVVSTPAERARPGCLFAYSRMRASRPVTLLRPHLDANNVEMLLDQRVSSRPLMNGKTFSLFSSTWIPSVASSRIAWWMS